MSSSSKNGSVLRKEDIIPPGARSAAKAAARSIVGSIQKHREIKSLGGAIDQVYKEWKEEATPAHKRSSYQHMEALVYKTVRNFRTYQLPIARGRAILEDIGNPDLCLGDVVKVLHRIAAAVKSYGIPSVRNVPWSSTALKEHVTAQPVDDNMDSSTDSEDSDDEEEMQKPVPPHKMRILLPASQPSVFARKSIGGKAPPSIENKSAEHESTFEMPAPKRQAVEEIPPFVANTPPSLVSLSDLLVNMRSNEISKPPPSSSSSSSNTPASSQSPPPPSSNAHAFSSSSSSNTPAFSQSPPPSFSSSSSSNTPAFSQSPPPASSNAHAFSSSSSSSSNAPASSQPPHPELESYGWDGRERISPSSSPPPLQRDNNTQTVYEMQNQIAQIDKDVTYEWNNTHSIRAIDNLIRKHNSDLTRFDGQLTDHWDQLSLSLFLCRMFHERTSRSTFHDSRVVDDVIVSILRGSITGNIIGKMYNPNMLSMRELVNIASRKQHWEVLITCMTFHMRNDKAARANERGHLHFLRKILLSEADEWVWK